MKRVLVLRPQPGASATAARVRERGFDPVVIPLFEIEPVEWRAPDAGGFDALLLTSANAVHCAGDRIQTFRRVPVYAVGPATADAARNAGFEIAGTGNFGIDRLLDSISPNVKLLHLAGEERKIPTDAGRQIASITVYRSKPMASVDLSAIRNVAALIHSPRAGRRFAELVEDKGSIAIAAISTEAGEAAGEGWAAVAVAEAPTDEALLALMERLCNKTAAT